MINIWRQSACFLVAIQRWAEGPLPSPNLITINLSFSGKPPIYSKKRQLLLNRRKSRCTGRVTSQKGAFPKTAFTLMRLLHVRMQGVLGSPITLMNWSYGRGTLVEQTVSIAPETYTQCQQCQERYRCWILAISITPGTVHTNDRSLKGLGRTNSGIIQLILRINLNAGLDIDSLLKVI